MHFVYKCLEKHPLPDSLPSEMQKLLCEPSPKVTSNIPPIVPIPPQQQPIASLPQSQPSIPTPPSVMPIAPLQSQATTIMGNSTAITPPVPAATDNWIVPYDERAKFKSLFQSTDLDRDGYVSGSEIKGNLI